MFGEQIEIKTPEQFATMRQAGLVVGQTLQALKPLVVPGVTTAEIDAVAREHLAAAGATSNFLNYHGFPATICISVNDEIVHGIPGSRVVADGDLVSLDFGAIIDGWHGDSAITVAVGEVAHEHAELNRVTEEAMWRGIAAARIGGRVGDISHAIESYVKSQSRSVADGTESPTASPVMASALPCTWRPTCRTAAGAARAPRSLRAWRWRSSP